MSVAITFSNLKSMIPTLLSGDESNLYSVLIRGRHGIGKSWIAYQTASGLRGTVHKLALFKRAKLLCLSLRFAHLK